MCAFSQRIRPKHYCCFMQHSHQGDTLRQRLVLFRQGGWDRGFLGVQEFWGGVGSRKVYRVSSNAIRLGALFGLRLVCQSIRDRRSS
jgi:hypothetical protein